MMLVIAWCSFWRLNNFTQADESYREAIVGLKPDKEKHQFFIDIVPEFGFPLAIR